MKDDVGDGTDKGAGGDARLNERMNALNWDALDRYFSGEADAHEREAIEKDDRRTLDQVRELWDAAGVVPKTPARDVDSAWRRLNGNLDDHGRRITPPKGTRGIIALHAEAKRRAWIPALVAAAAVIVAAFGYTTWSRARDAALAKAAIASSAAREYATKRAQRADVYLSDGTRVLLNVDSRLRVPADYGRGAREVVLEGEAYFDVVHDSTRPFRVRTAGGVAEDLGTAFVVARYDGDEMRVVVRSGLVRVGGEMLKQREAARVDTAGRVFVRRGVDVESEMAWTAGRLVFDRVPLAEVLPRMSRWFDTDVRLADSALAGVRYTASFRNEPVEQVLELMAKSLGASVEKDPRTNGYVIRARQ
jgi:transmembrane sensor